MILIIMMMGAVAALVAVSWIILILAPCLLLLAMIVAPFWWAKRRLRDRRGVVAERLGSMVQIFGLTSGSWRRAVLERELRRLVGSASPGACATACACVRQRQEGYVGTMRFHGAAGHHLVTVQGGTRDRVARRLIRFGVGQQKFPMEGAIGVEPTDDCNPATCPLGWPFSSTVTAASAGGKVIASMAVSKTAIG